MTYAAAIALAIRELEREIRHLSMDATLYERGVATYQDARHAYDERERLRAAVALLSSKSVRNSRTAQNERDDPSNTGVS